MTNHDAVVLVIGSGMQRYREYLLASAATRHRLWLIDDVEPSWQSAHLAGSSVADVLDHDAVLAAAREVAARRPVAGILSWDERLVVATARAAHALGLPGAGVDGIEGCRDKHRTRRLLTAAGLPQPRYAWADDADDAVRAAQEIGLPVVVKPRGMGASIGVVLARDVDEVRAAFLASDAASRDGAVAYQGGALVEEYLDGPEISVDGAVVDGTFRPLFLARKDVGLFPWFEETGHTVDAADPLLADDELLDMLDTVHRVLGVGTTMTHTELKLTRRGPVVVEVNGRLGGDLIPLLGRHATGVDPGVVAVEVALGLHVEHPATRNQVAGVRFGYPEEDGVVLDVSLPDERPAHLLAAEALVEPGAVLRLPPAAFISRHSYVICTAGSVPECRARLDEAAANVRTTTRPLVRDAEPSVV